MDAPVLTERRKLNEEIERTFINAAFFARRFRKYQQTDRSETILDLFEGFYSEFDLLVMLTCNLQQLRKDKEQKQGTIAKAEGWLDDKIPPEDDSKIAARMTRGIAIFKNYTKMLYDEGVVSMPSGGGGR